jgi:hypothetical protein
MCMNQRACREPAIYAAALRLLLRLGERRRALEVLFARTAAAFGSHVPVPPTLRRNVQAQLAEYARFTRDHAEAALRSGQDLEGLQQRLFRAGRSMGARYRVRLGVHTPAGAMTAARLLYRGLDIDFAGYEGGEVVISRCSFARVYSPQVCALVSGLDRGLLAGLSNGGDLRFSGRITEGAGSCRARLEGVSA